MRGCSPFTRVSTNYRKLFDSMPKDSAALQNDDEYLCDKEVGVYA